MKARAISGLVVAAAVVIGVLYIAGNTLTTVHADEIVVKQNAIDGELNFWVTAGVHNQSFGKITKYKKSAEYSFSAAPDQGKSLDQSIKVRFNDGGHAQISGTLRFELPTDPEHLTALHTKFGSQTAIEGQLLRPVVERAVYMTGPLMSSKESAAERRADLIQYIEDQVTNGVYRTETEEKKERDAISGQDRTVTRVKLVKDEKQPNEHARQEASPLTAFGIKTYSFNVNGIAYDKEVEDQIRGQQALAMQVQTAIASAKQAEQEAITVTKQGEAAAAKAKWVQEAAKATAVTAAEQEAAVAKVQNQKEITVAEKEVEVQRRKVQAAELFKREQTLIGEGEAARRKAVMVADGALEKKLETWLEAQKAWAAAAAQQPWVPEVMIGGGGSGGGNTNAATNLVELMGVKAAHDLALDIGAARTVQTASVKK